MTAVTPERPSSVLDDSVLEGLRLPTPEPPAPDDEHDEARGEEDEHQVNPTTTSLAVFLAVAGAGWMVGGIFTGFLPRVFGVLGAGLGAGLVALSFRTRRPGTIQSFGVPVAAIGGALLVLPFTSEGGGLPDLVTEAVRLGGAASPPVPFDPGWRFILFFIMSLLGTGAASVAIATRRPQIGIFLPVPIILGGALAQPAGTPIVLTALAVALVPAALSIAHGAELARDGATSGRFEARRLSRSAGVLVGMVAALFLLSQIGLLPSDDERQQVVPPQPPPPPVAQPDRVLFKVTAPRPLNWRLGVLDVYDGRRWLLPPYDVSAFRSIPQPGSILAGLADDPPQGYKDEPPPPPPPSIDPAAEKVTVKFEIADLGGRVLPTVANTAIVRGVGRAKYDPRNQVLRFADQRASSDVSYEVEAKAPPSAADLTAAPPPPASVQPFLDVPPPPASVTALLSVAPAGPLFDRLQFVRNEYFQKVVAAGEGKVSDVTPKMVGAMLDGGEGTPYEITAGEVLLARWAGVPARMGFGFFGGAAVEGEEGTFEVRPRHGATWLEVYFEGHGWVPILGQPAQAKSSLDDTEKKNDPNIKPSEDIALTAYLPIRLTSYQLLFEIVRYWLVRAIGVIALVAAVWALFPGLVKMARRRRRLRWAVRQGPLERIAVAYTEFRDAANDLNVGTTVLTPIELVRRIEPDAEHQELAWLTSRALWGDLQRDLSIADAEAAEDASRSVIRRLRRAQSPLTRILAFSARVSLRAPYTDEVPNLWPSWAVPGALRRGVNALLRWLFRPVGRGLRAVARVIPRRRPAPAAALVLLVVAMAALLGGCGSEDGPPPRAGPVLPTTLVPEGIGDLRFQQEPVVEESFNKPRPESLVDEGRVFTIRRNDDVLGGLQAAAFKAGLVKSEEDGREVRDGVLTGLGSGSFEQKRLGKLLVWEQIQREQKLYVWFSPDMTYFELLVAKAGFEGADQVFGAVLAFQQGTAVETLTENLGSELLNPRRGGLH